MSRAIKFRVWDTSSNKWVSGLKITLDGRLKDIDFDDEGKYEFYVSPEQYIIEQYTGLKDKNDKEIYEGDIVKNIEGVNETAVCVWDEGNAEFDFRCRDGKYTRDNVKSWLEMYEVIGNIHESNMEELCPKE